MIHAACCSTGALGLGSRLAAVNQRVLVQHVQVDAGRGCDGWRALAVRSQAAELYGNDKPGCHAWERVHILPRIQRHRATDRPTPSAKLNTEKEPCSADIQNMYACQQQDFLVLWRLGSPSRVLSSRQRQNRIELLRPSSLAQQRYSQSGLRMTQSVWYRRGTVRRGTVHGTSASVFVRVALIRYEKLRIRGARMCISYM